MHIFSGRSVSRGSGGSSGTRFSFLTIASNAWSRPEVSARNSVPGEKYLTILEGALASIPCSPGRNPFNFPARSRRANAGSSPLNWVPELAVS